MKISIRPAKSDDIVWLLEELEKFSNFYGTKLSLFGEISHAHGAMLNLIENHLVLIADKQSVGPVGFIAGVVSSHPFNPNIRVLAEYFWWVEEAYRGSRAGPMLLNEFTAWGEQHADWITFSLEHHSPVNDRSLSKRGYRLQEKSFLKEVV